VNEVAVRPLSPQGLAARIHAIVTRPQSFILSPNYRGPDRRIAPLSNELEEQRIQLVPTVASRAEAALYMPDAGTKVILPDFSLRMKVNLAAVSAGLMSHEAVEKEFINEGLEDVDRINYLFGKIEPAIGSRAPMERMCTSSHIVQARAEAYEYQLCAKIAGFLTDFCKHYFNVHNPTHRVVLEKHIQALQVVLKTNMRGDGGKKGAELAQELSKLVFKFV
jgi:hypothetical protein